MDLKDAYLIHEEDRAFLKFSFKELMYQVPMPSFWPGMCPLGLQQDPEASRGPAETAGGVTNRLRRRHTDLGRVEGGGLGPCNRYIYWRIWALQLAEPSANWKQCRQ